MGKTTNIRKAVSLYAIIADLIVVVGISGFLYLGLQIRNGEHSVAIPSPAAAKVLPTGFPERAR